MTDQFVLPERCYSCGAYLMGGATKHQPGCEILKLIEEAKRKFGGGSPGEPGAGN